MIDLAVKIETPRNQIKAPKLRDAFTRRGRRRIGRFASRLDRNVLEGKEIPYGIAIALGSQIKRRVAVGGKPVDRAEPYPAATVRGGGGRVSRRERAIFINPPYPARGALTTTPGGWHLYRHSAQFHQRMGAKVGTFHVSGGMWDGLSVVPRGRSKAVLMFRSTSIGWGRGKRLKRGGRSRAKINNTLKAWTVFESKRVNVLRETQPERETIADAVEILIADDLAEMTAAVTGATGQWTASSPADRRFLKAILDAVGGTASASAM